MNGIEWTVTEQNISQELSSADNRWHISRKQEGEGSPKCFLSNYDLLAAPHGTGADYRECFAAFIADCDAYMNKVKEIRAEAQAVMDGMINSGKEPAGEN